MHLLFLRLLPLFFFNVFTHARVYCTDAPTWLHPGYKPEDCTLAIQKMYQEDVARWQGNEFEFLAPGAHQVHPEPAMHTPLKYNHGEQTRS